MKILVVDDDFVVQTVVAKMLRTAGYDVDCASGGKEALERIARETPSCVFLDLYMDDMSGFDVLIEIRQKFDKETCPVIMISSEDDATSVGVALEFGANDFLFKPVSADILRSKISELFPKPESPPSAGVLQPGHCLGPYKIERLLRDLSGEATYQALDQRLGRQVSIKISPAAEYEATVLARVNHRNVLTVHDVVLEPFPYLVTELVDGEPIESRVPCPNSGEAIRWTREILRGAGALHAQGLVHTCLNPTTVTITRAGHICLTDLGAAAPTGTTPLKGTRQPSNPTFYTAPELKNGDLKSLSPAADLFSACALFHLFLTGSPPPAAQTGGMDLPPDLSKVLQRGLSPKPEDRFLSADDFRGALGPGLRRAMSSR